jgi:hypothetical protein
MDRFLDRQNIELYRRLRETPSAAERQQIMKLLAEGETKFKLEFTESGVPPRVRLNDRWRHHRWT